MGIYLPLVVFTFGGYSHDSEISENVPSRIVLLLLKEFQARYKLEERSLKQVATLPMGEGDASCDLYVLITIVIIMMKMTIM